MCDPIFERERCNIFISGGTSSGKTTFLNALLKEVDPAERLILIGPAVTNFTMAPVPADTIVIHGETDDVVPLAGVLDWARPQVLPITVVPGTGHFFHGQIALLKSLVLGAWRPH